MKKTLTMFVLIGTLAGCTTKQDGLSLFMQDAVPPSAPPLCTVDPGSTVAQGRGTRDIAVTPLSLRGFVLAPRVLNNMATVDEDQLRFRGYDNVKVEVNTLYLDGYNVCVEDGRDPSVTTVDPGASCFDLPAATKAFVPAVGSVAPGQRAVASADILPPEIGADLGEGLIAGESKLVIIHVQASARTGDGRRVTSNEMQFPVTICNGCLSTVCPTGFQLKTDSVCLPGQDDPKACEAIVAAPTR